MTDSGALGAVLFVGRPGSGKGTQAHMLAARLGWPLFSSGNHFKDLILKATPLGERIRDDYNRGKLSPDWIADYFFEEAILSLLPGQGLVSEGFPRSLPQAELADEVLAWLGRPYKVIHLAVSEDSALTRQLGRAKTEHRPDSDADEKIRGRFDVYRTHTEPVLDFFRTRGALIDIDGEKAPEQIASDIARALELS
ncbi:MAG: nucleoside monophosphate kinase [bacterium]